MGEAGVWVHNANCDGVKLFNTGENPSKDLIPDGIQLFPLEAKLAQAIRDGALPRNGFAIIKKSGADFEKTLSPEDLKRWLRFEDDVAGRLIVDGVRQEYAVIFENAKIRGREYIRVEGQEISASGSRVFIDRKLEFYKINSSTGADKALDIFWRISQALEQNPKFRSAFEIEAGAKGRPLAAFRDAEAFIADILRNDSSSPVFAGDKDGSRMALIRKMLGGVKDEAGVVIEQPRIELRNEGTPTGFPLTVLSEGKTIRIAALTSADIQTVFAAARQYWLNAGAPAALLDNASINIADLPSGQVGQSQGQTITLDANAAGWGWFVDKTPGLQEEFQASDSAQDFKALDGSAAQGKLDLLTVLIHEMGHALGLGHTHAFGDVMSSVLTPSERRLPGAADQASLKALGWWTANRSGNTVTVPGAAHGSTSGGSVVYTDAVRAKSPQNEATPYATITNGNFSGATPEAALTGWVAQGNVRVDGGVVTLGESAGGQTSAVQAAVQTHLAQLFMLNPGDRALTFTIDARGLAAHPNGIGPADAFEVALLDPNTEVPVLGTTGLSHTDALLNVQAVAASNSATSNASAGPMALG